MRRRFDFSSISQVILEHAKENSISQEKYYESLFEFALKIQKELKIEQPEQGNLNKIINGTRKVQADILDIYNKPQGLKKLEKGVSNILNVVDDQEMLREQIHNLLTHDRTMSFPQKKNLLKVDNSLSTFIASCILYGMNRKFISRKAIKTEIPPFDIADFVLDHRLPSVNAKFFGRDNDLKEIHVQIKEDSHLFLEGIGGIGKTELAKQYAYQYKEEYINILFLKYNESLKKTIILMNFVDDKPEMSDEDLFDTHYRFFKLLPENTLVILDNFDTAPENESLLYDFLSLSFHLLVTTRNHIDEVRNYLVGEIEDMNELVNLFYAYAPIAEAKPHIVTKIIDEVYRHTLTVEMAAKTLTAADLTPESLLSALQKEGIALSNPNKIKVTKDAQIRKERLYSHIQTLFHLHNLSSKYHYILRQFLLMPNQGIQKSLFYRWMNLDDLNDINELIEYGWMKEDRQLNYISIHPILHEVLIHELKPDIDNCKNILESIQTECIYYVKDVEYYPAIIDSLEKIFDYVDFNDSYDAFIFMERAMAFLDKYEKNTLIEKVLDIMSKKIPIDEMHPQYAGNYYCYKGGLCCNKENYQMAYSYFQKGLDIVKPFEAEMPILLVNLYNNLSVVAPHIYNNIDVFVKLSEKAIEIRNKYKLLTVDSFVQDINLASVYAKTGRADEAVKRLHSTLSTIPDSPDYGILRSEVYQRLATIFFIKDPKKSELYFTKAYQLRARHFPENDPELIGFKNGIKNARHMSKLPAKLLEELKKRSIID